MVRSQSDTSTFVDQIFTSSMSKSDTQLTFPPFASQATVNTTIIRIEEVLPENLHTTLAEDTVVIGHTKGEGVKMRGAAGMLEAKDMGPLQASVSAALRLRLDFTAVADSFDYKHRQPWARLWR